MYREEDQRTEIEKIQRAVNESLRARRAFRVAKKQSRAVQARPIVPAVDREQGAESDTTEAFQTQSLLKTEPSQLQQDHGSNLPVPLPMSNPWPTTLVEPQHWGSPDDAGDALNIDNTLTLYNTSPFNNTFNLDFDGHSNPAAAPFPMENGISYPFTFHPGAPQAENANDLEMIMNYLDNIFPLQYYFYQPSAAERGRGWLLSILLRSKPLYYTALAFSSVQKVIASRDDTVEESRFLEELDHQHALAMAGLAQQLERLPGLKGQEHLRLGIEILACTIQLQSMEIFRNKKWWKGWKGDWEVHTNAAGALLSVIGNNLDQSASFGTSTTSDDSSESQSTLSTDTMASFLCEIAGLDFFMSSYIWSDIMRCANVGVKPSMQDSFFYLNYLEEGRIQLDRVMGCRNWAMISIREISGLEAWRNEMLSGLKNPVLTGQSSEIDNLIVPLLIGKSSEIKARLQRGYSSIPTNMEGLTKHDRETELVTNIFGISAAIYLAIVVSGSFGRLPEVHQDVLRALHAMKALPRHLFMRVSWPFCVAGCMAECNIREDFKELLSETKAQGHPMGQLWNALDLIEAFWKIRELIVLGQHIDACPWALAMKSTEMKTLLI